MGRVEVERPAVSGPSAMTHQRYVLITLLFFHTVNTYMDRIVISAAAGEIQRDLGASSQMMGYMFGIFALGYALFQIPAGWFADRFGPRKALTWVVGVWSVFTALSGAAWNAASMLTVRFLFGVGEAGAFPGATRALYSWVPPKERGIAQGIFHSGARVGAAMSLLLMPLLVRAVGWRLTFVINGLIGLVWAAAWLGWFRDDPRRNPRVGAAELAYIEEALAQEEEIAESRRVPLPVVLTSLNMLLAMFQYMASNMTFFISFTWLLPYLVERWGTAAELYAPIPLLIGTFAHWTSGGLVTWLHDRGHPVASRRLPAMFGFALAVVGLVLTTRVAVDSPLPFVLAFSVAVFGVEMTIAPSWSFAMDIGGKSSGVVSASMNMLGNIGSAISAVIFPYFVANVTLPYFAETTGTANSFFVLAAAVNATAVVAWLFMDPQKELDPDVDPARLRMRIALFAVLVALALGLIAYNIFFRG